MTEHDDVVYQQKLLLEAEKWAVIPKWVHVHSLSSMWYDDRPQDTSDGKVVMDKEYNNGIVERTLSTGEVYVFTKYELRGDDLIGAYTQNN